MLLGKMAAVNIPQDYYFLGPKNARYIPEAIWGNPDDTSIVGMIFPKPATLFDESSWAITLTYDNIGYVSDANAEGYDYTDLLKTMQQDVIDENDWRLKNGLGKVELLGWAKEPHYDKVGCKLYWAKTLHFDGEPKHPLNYNICAFCRKGVLIINFIADADQLSEIEAAAHTVMKMVSFTTGNTYADYISGANTFAAVGIGGLIAGKVLANTGMLLLALAFLKKGTVLIVLPLIRLKNKLFGKRPES